MAAKKKTVEKEVETPTAEVKKENATEETLVTDKVVDNAKSFATFFIDSCIEVKNDVNTARVDGDKYAQDLVSSFKTNDKVDSLVAKSAGIMGQMVAGGVTLLMCPMRIVAKELSDKK